MTTIAYFVSERHGYSALYEFSLNTMDSQNIYGYISSKR